VRITRNNLEQLYVRFNRPEFISPDPLEWVIRYPALADREVAGLVAAGLAYGRVASILTAIDQVLAPLGNQPSERLATLAEAELRDLYQGFKYRWTTADELVDLLLGIRQLQARPGGMQGVMLQSDNPSDSSLMTALDGMTEAILAVTGRAKNSLLPRGVGGSACKRSMLFLRWMVRRDDVDPGGWDQLDPRRLLIPLDTHMAAFARQGRLTRCKTPNRKMAESITASFARRNPEDPVKYDFAITRMGIRGELSTDDFFR